MLFSALRRSLLIGKVNILSGLYALNSAVTPFTMSSVISGNNVLTKSGIGAISLTNNNNSFSKGIAVSSGILGGTNSNCLGSGTASISKNAQIQLDCGQGSYTSSIPAFNGSGSLLITGNNQIQIQNTINGFSGGTFVLGGATLNTPPNTSIASILGTGQLFIDSGSVVNINSQNNGLNAGNTLLFSGVSGSGTINFNGTTGGNTIQTKQVSSSLFVGTININPSGTSGVGKTQLNFTLNPSASINVGTNGTLYVVNGNNFPGNIILNGGTTGETLGQLRIETSGSNITGNVILSGSVSTGTIGNNVTGVTVMISGPIVGNFRLIKTGPGTIIFGGGNTYTGGSNAANQGTLINQGVIVATTLNSVTGSVSSSSFGVPTSPSAGTINLGNATLTGNLIVISPGETTDRIVNLGGSTGGGAIYNSGSGYLKFTSDLSITGNGTKSFTMGGTGPMEFVGAISDNSPTNKTYVTKSNANTVTLSGNNTYTGNTQLLGGTLMLGSGTALGSASNSCSINLSSSLDLNGQTILNNIFTTGATPTITNSSSSTATINSTITNGNAPIFISGSSGNIVLQTVTGTSGLTITKNGTNTLILSGSSDNAFCALKINNGLVVLNKSGSGHSSNNLTLISGTVQFGSNNVSLLTGTGQLATTTIHGGTFDLSGSTGNNTTLGSLSGSGGIITNNGSVSSTLTIGGNNGGGANYAGTLQNGTNTLFLTKIGTAAITMSGNSTHTGSTSITGGELQINGSFSGSTILINGGRLSGTGSVGSVILSNTANSVIVGGLGTGSFGSLLMTGSLYFSGSTCALDVYGNGSTAASSIAVSGSTTLNSATINFLQTLNTGTYNLITNTVSCAGLTTIGTNNTGHTPSCSIVGNNLIATIT